MKILILGFTKLMYMPYINFYIEEVRAEENEVHVMYWNRDEKEDIELPYANVKRHEFYAFQEDEIEKCKKIKNFVYYRKYSKKIIKNEGFDLIIVLHTLPAILLYDVLMSTYKNKYILDYRDYTYERIKIYKYAIKRLVESSIATFISSEGFKKYLPNTEKIYISHNILLDSLKFREKKAVNNGQTKIKISFWGFIRHENINTKLIKKLANDERFELHYYGREQTTAINLKKFCSKEKIENVFFHGKYEPKDRYDFAKQTDLVHNIYENDRQMINAMANKYYDGITFYIPQLCNKGSFMGERVENKGLGIVCSMEEENFADNLYKEYISIRWEEFYMNCDKELDAILEEYSKGIEIINNTINPKRKNENV